MVNKTDVFNFLDEWVTVHHNINDRTVAFLKQVFGLKEPEIMKIIEEWRKMRKNKKLESLYEQLFTKEQQDKLVDKVVNALKTGKLELNMNEIKKFIQKEQPGLTLDQVTLVANDALTKYRTIISAARKEKLNKMVEKMRFKEEDDEDYQQKIERLLEQEDQIDTVEMCVPLMIRMFELFNENKFSDEDLHKIASRMVLLSKERGALQMKDYDDIVSGEQVESFREADSPMLILTIKKLYLDGKPVGWIAKKLGLDVDHVIDIIQHHEKDWMRKNESINYKEKLENLRNSFAEDYEEIKVQGLVKNAVFQIIKAMKAAAQRLGVKDFKVDVQSGGSSYSATPRFNKIPFYDASPDIQKKVAKLEKSFSIHPAPFFGNDIEQKGKSYITYYYDNDSKTKEVDMKSLKAVISAIVREISDYYNQIR